MAKEGILANLQRQIDALTAYFQAGCKQPGALGEPPTAAPPAPYLASPWSRAWAALGNLIPVLERTVSLGKRDCEVECDFTAQETRIIARADLTLFFWQLVFLLF